MEEDYKRYLDKNFNYRTLTKGQLRDVMSQFNVSTIPPLSAKKDVILKAYKQAIFDRIEELKQELNVNFSEANIFQSSASSHSLKSPVNRSFSNNSSASNVNKSFNSPTEELLNDSFANSNASFVSVTAQNRSDVSNAKNISSSREQQPMQPEIKIPIKAQLDLSPSKRTAAHTHLSTLNLKKSQQSLTVSKPMSSITDLRESKDDVKSFVGSTHSTYVSSLDTQSNKATRNSASSEFDESILSTASSAEAKQQGSRVVLDPESFYKSSYDLQRSYEEDGFLTRIIKRAARITFFILKGLYRGVKLIFKVVLLLSLVLLLYMKFFMPYCRGGENATKWCIPLPKYGSVTKEGQLACVNNYRPKFSFINYCKFDESIIERNKREFSKVLKMLQRIKGECVRGYRKSSKVKVGKVTENLGVIEMLKGSSEVILSQGGEVIEAVDERIPIWCILTKFMVKVIKLTVTFILIYVLVKYLYVRYRRGKILKKEAQKYVQPILESLRRQMCLVIKCGSSGSRDNPESMISETISSEQLKDAFGIKNDVWVYVEKCLKTNPNVEATHDFQSKTCSFKWIGPLYFESKDL